MPKAIRIHEHGGPEVLRLEDVDVPPPAPDEVQIRHTAIGVNYIDVYDRTGLYPVSLPSGLGREAAGVVVARGKKVRDVRVGERVAYFVAQPGSYAEIRNIPAARVVKVPKGVSDEQAAALMLKGMTAQYLVRRTYRVKRRFRARARRCGRRGTHLVSMGEGARRDGHRCCGERCESRAGAQAWVQARADFRP
jgi:NADPH2:quinone reductase